jgi:microcystin-dependent protein
MAIQLRTNKASALTYNEMDRNFSSFFYSASIDNGNILKLWYTGSSTLNTAPGDDFGPARFVPIDLQPTTGAIPTLTVAGNPRAIQFRHSTNPILDADNGFLYTTSQQLGIGVTTPATNTKIHAAGTTALPATLRLESTTSATSQHKRATVDFYRGSTFMGTIGKDNNSNNALYIKTYPGLDDGFTKTVPPGNLIINIGNNINSGAWTPVGLGIGTLLPQHALQVQGTGYFTGKLAVGDIPNTAALNVFQTAQTGTSLGDFETIAKFGITPQENVDSLKILSVRQLAGGNNWWSNGMRIQQDVDGTYRTYIQFSGEGNLHGFSIGTGQSTSPHKPGDVGIVERFRIDSYGNISMNKTLANAKLDVNGDTIVTGSFTTTGNATIKGTAAVDFSLTTGTTVAVGTNLTVTGTATIGNIPAGTAGAGTKILTANNAGQIQYITGTFPLGGIIMWAGSPTALPTGWALCDGTGTYGPVGNTSPIPDLRERFIVGAGVEPNKTVIDYSAPFTLTSFVVPSVNNTTFTIDTTNPYYIDGAGIPRQGVNPVDGKRYHLYKGPGSTSASTFKFIIYDNRFNTYEVIQGALPTWGSAFPPGPAVIYAGDDKGGTTFYKSYESQNGRHFMSYDTFAEYDKHFVNGRRLAWKEVNWATTTSPGYAVGDKGGADNVVLLGSQSPKHQHDSVSGENGGNGATYGFTGGNGYPGARDSDNVHNLTSAYGNNQPHENRPPYYALAFIIYTGV